jgi:hypothetical protein
MAKIPIDDPSHWRERADKSTTTPVFLMRDIRGWLDLNNLGAANFFKTATVQDKFSIRMLRIYYNE